MQFIDFTPFMFSTPQLSQHSVSQHPTSQPPGHILFITGEYPPMPGGVGAYTAELAAALVDRGWRVSVLTSVRAGGNLAENPNLENPTPALPSLGRGRAPLDDEFTLPLDPGGRKQNQRGDEIAVLSLDPGKGSASGITIYPVMAHWGWHLLHAGVHWARRVGADWVHVQYQTAAFQMHPAINFAPAWWQRQGVRVAWTYHDLLVPYLFPKAGARLRRWITERPARVCDLTICTNAGDHDGLVPVARRLANIPIGSNIHAHLLTPEERKARRAQRGYGDDDLVIGYFGFLNRSKGGLDLVETVARLLPDLPTVRLLMIGERVGASDPTNYAYLQEVEAAIRMHGLADRVTWTGHQPNAEVSADLAACDLLLMPYLDGASLRRGTLMAGLAHGCAIVTTTPSAPIPELVEGRDLIYVPPGDVDAAAAAVLHLARNPADLASLRQNAVAASAAFTWEGIAEAHERLYVA